MNYEDRIVTAFTYAAVIWALLGMTVGVYVALVPPPRVHLTRYHGVFAPHAARRAAVTPAGRGRAAGPARPSVRRRGTWP